MLSFRAITSLVLLVGLLPLVAFAGDSDWSHRYPPPVKVAPLVRKDVVRGEVRQASHLDETSTVAHPSWVDDQVQPIPENYNYQNGSVLPWRSPPHLTIEAPSMKKPSSRQPTQYSGDPVVGHHAAGVEHRVSPSHSNFGTAGHAQSSQGHSVHGHSIHGPLIPTMPGVENDPSSVGPGRIGLGTHWIKNYPQHRQTIPNATVAPRWKSPYSYGHFGAEGKRHWTRQHGYRDRYLQWTLR